MKRREFLTASALAGALPAVSFAFATGASVVPARAHFALGYLEGSESTLAQQPSDCSWRDALRRGASGRKPTEAVATVRVLGLQASAGAWPELDALTVQARINAGGGAPAQFLLWQMQRSGNVSASSPVRFSARLDSLSGFALDYRLIAAGGASCIRGDNYCAMTDLFNPLLKQGLYVLAGPREGLGSPPIWSELGYSGDRQRPLRYQDGRATDFDALVLSVALA